MNLAEKCIFFPLTVAFILSVLGAFTSFSGLATIVFFGISAVAFIVTGVILAGLSTLLSGSSIGFLTFNITMPTVSWYMVKIIFVSTSLGGLWISYLMSSIMASTIIKGVPNIWSLYSLPYGIGTLFIIILSIMYGYGIFAYISSSGGTDD